MMTSNTKKRIGLGLVAASILGSALSIGSANADPKQYTAAVGVGSDTVQDVMNALAGSTNGISYTPINSGSATSFRQEISFDAFPPVGVADTCITSKLNGPSYTRPNGSTGGRKALYAASGLSTVGWTGVPINGAAICSTAVDVSGQVDFARSSAGPAAGDIGTDITYIPFGRDAMSFAYYRAAGLPVTTLTRAQLTTLFTTGPQIINGVRIVPCGIQTSSGTYAFWQKVTTATTSQENTATTECNSLTAGVRSEENDGTALKTRGDLLAAAAGTANDQVVIGFSAGAFIAKSNLAAPGTPPATVGMGSISDNGSGTNIGLPITGTAPALAPASSFYGDSVFGRNIYVVLPTTVATGIGNAAIKALFVGATSAICNATATINTFGFLPNASCGSTATKGSWITGAS